MTIAVLGIDLGKNSCSLVGLDAAGRVVLRRRMRREGVIAFGAKLPGCVVAMEACCGAHHMGRTLAKQGHTVRLMSPEYVRPYVKAQKNDDRDAEAIAEAATRPTMRFVALKSEAQLDVQTLHRVRDQLVGERTALTNQIRSVLLERGHVVAQGRAKLTACLTALLDTDAGASLTPRMRTLVAEVRERWQDLDRRIAALDAEFAEQARINEDARRLTTIPGIGALNATALVAAIGDVASFARGRDLAAWSRTAAGDDWREASARRHHQARQQVPAQDAGPGCPRRAALAAPERHPSRAVAARAAGAVARQYGGSRPGGQDGAHRLGAAAPRAGLRAGGRGCLIRVRPTRTRRPSDVCGR
jgi:transposase